MDPELLTHLALDTAEIQWHISQENLMLTRIHGKASLKRERETVEEEIMIRLITGTYKKQRP